eukprot:CAMPEP_0118955538 /NCGR_PEP_ID=MMETSP1169-20130426/60131_1 /TAXON_ID=36882 /ORGANISM="Pyramimonas obovata, Strain CCMP722" /LENGTH=317 /DNA_ID=CAMNT_0006903411 /DNA_START=124 /DNA_END=1073 /DNA_ORIENTATION=+
MKYDNWDVALLAVAFLYVVFVPYTKVEESFNLQATHDFLFHRFDLEQYDHLEFPGVVPRTFWGALGLTLASSPTLMFLRAMMMPKILDLYVVRMTLAFGTVASLANFRAALREQLGGTVAKAFAALYLVQFHGLFYAGRPLPNVFATILTTWAAAAWVRGKQPRKVLALVVLAMIVFRCDCVLLLCPLTLVMLGQSVVTVPQVLQVGVAVGAAALATSVALDSVMWRRLIWPEGEVLWFNTVENRSGEWGVMPFHWYYTNALPRSLLAAAVLAPLGAFLERRVRGLALAALGFITLYSNLPHKELRFIFPAIPLLNA